MYIQIPTGRQAAEYSAKPVSICTARPAYLVSMYLLLSRSRLLSVILGLLCLHASAVCTVRLAGLGWIDEGLADRAGLILGWQPGLGLGGQIGRGCGLADWAWLWVGR